MFTDKRFDTTGGKLRIRNFLENFLEKWWIDLIFPRRCPICDEIVDAELLIHEYCLKELKVVKQPTCKKCGKQVLEEQIEYCQDCNRRKRSFDGGIAIFCYEGKIKDSLIKIKYKNKKEYLDFYGAAMGRKIEKWVNFLNVEMLIPVPIHPARKKERGFNQSEILAEKVSCRIKIPCRGDFLIRNKNTMPQKQLNPDERLKNLEQAFLIANTQKIPESILLIDDIYTTGSTMEACARVLKESGVKKVYCAVVAIGNTDV